METQEESTTIQKVGIKYGLLVFAGLVAYFLIMKLVGLFEVIELRALNFIILSAGIWKAMTFYKKKNALGYFEGLKLGILTSFVAVIPFAVFVFFYLQADVQFMNHLIANEPFGQYLNSYTLAFLIMFEGGISGGMLSFIFMQLLKKSRMVSAD